jgi:hypothetical protein
LQNPAPPPEKSGLLPGCHEFAWFILADIQNGVQFGNFKNLPEGICQVAQNEPAIQLAEALVQKYQHVPRNAGKIGHITEIQDQFSSSQDFHQMGQLNAKALNGIFIQFDVVSLKSAYGHVFDVLPGETP